MTKDIMTATHEDKTYVASHSLDKRLKRTENMLSVVIMLLIIVLAILGAVALLKWPVIVAVLGL